MGNPTVPPLYEQWHDGGFIVSEANGHRSRDKIVLTGSKLALAGTVLGAISIGVAAVAAALGANTGNGTFGTITPVAVPTQIGVYQVAFTAATAFTVTAPNGATATGTTGVAFSAMGVGFTISAGGTAFVAGDTFAITTTALADKPTAAAVAGSNTGNGTCSAVTTTGNAPQLGVYTVEFDDATHFVVNSPAGQEIGHGTTGVAFAGGGLAFTITAGGTAFVAGDSFTVTMAANSNSGKFAPLSLTAADGSAVAAAILFGATDATLADKSAAAITRAAEVNASELVWPVGASASEIATGLAQLKAQGIIPR
jgi:hypothetical protein